MSQSTPSRPQQQGPEQRTSAGSKSAGTQTTPGPLSLTESLRNASQTSLALNQTHSEGQHHSKSRVYSRDPQNRRNSPSKHSNYHQHQNNTTGSAQFQGTGSATTEKQHFRGPRHHQEQGQKAPYQISHQNVHQNLHQPPHQISHQNPHQSAHQGYQSHHSVHQQGHQQTSFPRFSTHGHSRGASFQGNSQVGAMYNSVMTVDGQMYPLYPSYGDVSYAPAPQGQIRAGSPQAPFMAVKVPPQLSRVVMTDANGNPINLKDRLRHNRTHSTMEQDSSAAARNAPSSKTASHPIQASPAGTVPPLAPRAEPRAEPPAEFTLPAGSSDVAQKMKELIAAKRQKKLAEAKASEPKASESKSAEPKPIEPKPAEPKPAEQKPAEPKPAEQRTAESAHSRADSKQETKLPTEPKADAKPDEPKPEAKSVAEAEASSEAKPTGPKLDKLEPAQMGRWVPSHLRRIAEAQKAKGEVSLEASLEAKPGVEVDSKPESEGKLESKFDPKIETKEAKEEDNITKSANFKTKLASARHLAVEELATVKYPANMVSNPEAGRGQGFRYSPDFLIQFASRVPRAHYEQFSKIIGFEYLSGVPKWGSGMGMRGSMGGRGSSRSGHGGFAGPGGRGGRNGGGSARGGRINSRRGKGDRSLSRRDFNDHGPSEADLGPLHTVDNAWKPSSLSKESKKADSDDRLSPEEVQRKVKSLLNKMAWENFDSVAKKIRDIALQSVNEKDAFTLRQIIQLTFDKAIDEPHWSEIYASFFLYMHVGEGAIPQEVVDESDPGKTLRGVPVLRRYLLNMSQQEFEKGWGEISQLSGNVQMMSDEYYHAIGLKRRGLGLTQLIGEMLKKGLVSEKLVMGCFGRLATEEPTEDIVESMSKLICTVATTMINQGSGNVIDLAMNTLISWKSSGKLPNRLRFKILDMEDLARKKWVGVDEGNGPKTIAQVHQDALKKEQEAEREKVKSRQGSRRGNDFGRSVSGRGRK